MKDNTKKIILCACGCGQKTNVHNGVSKRFINHHYSGTEDSREKKSEFMMGKRTGESHPMFGTHWSDERRQERSKAMIGKRVGEKHPMFGKPYSVEARQKQSEAHMGEKNHMFGKHHTDESKKLNAEAHTNKFPSVETRQKMSDARMDKFVGEAAPNWKGGLSYLPYCKKFNEAKREEVRDLFERKCPICGKTEEQNGRKLSVHHIDYDKTQGCDGKDFHLMAVCRRCNTKANSNRDAWNKYLTSYFTGIM